MIIFFNANLFNHSLITLATMRQESNLCICIRHKLNLAWIVFINFYKLIYWTDREFADWKWWMSAALSFHFCLAVHVEGTDDKAWRRLAGVNSWETKVCMRNNSSGTEVVVTIVRKVLSWLNILLVMIKSVNGAVASSCFSFDSCYNTERCDATTGSTASITTVTKRSKISEDVFYSLNFALSSIRYSYTLEIIWHLLKCNS